MIAVLIRRRYSLKWRLTLLFSAGMLVLLLFLSIFIFFSTSNLVRQHEQKLLYQKANAIAADLKTEVTEEASLTFPYLNRLLTNYYDVNQSILVTDQNGKRLASIQGANWNKEVPDAMERIQVAKVSVQLPYSTELLQVEISTTTEALDWYFSILLTILLLASFITLVLSGIGGYLISQWGLKPLDHLIQQIHSIFPQRPSQRIHHHYVQTEIYELIHAFNLLLDRMEEALVYQQRFVTDASHELRTPLSIIEGYVSLLQRWGQHKPQVREEALTALSQECSRLFKLIDDLLSLAKLQDISHLGSTKVIQPLAPLLVEVKQAWLPIYPKQIKLSFEWEESLYLTMDRERIRQLLDILLDNARKYTDEGQVKVMAYDKNNGIHIVVEDTGIGIQEQEIPHLFKRFYRVDKSRNRKSGGSGIGLSIAQAIVADHEGSITITPSEKRGMRVHVVLKKAGASYH